MIQLKRAARSDRAAISALWQVEFGDDAPFIDAFCDWCGWEQLFLLREDGIPRSMIAAPLVELTLPDGGRAKGGYLYALTTDRAARGGGFGHMVLNYVDFCLQNQRAHCAVLVPAQPSLFTFFATAGYATAFTLFEDRVATRDIPAPPAGCALSSVTAADYAVLQEEGLARVPHMVSPLGLVEQQKALCVAAGGDLYALTLPHGKGCAAAEPLPDGCVLLREVIAPDGDETAALSLLHAALHAPSYTLRRPLQPGEEGCPQAKPFGVVKWYDPEMAQRWGAFACGYLGLALD